LILFSISLTILVGHFTPYSEQVKFLIYILSLSLVYKGLDEYLKVIYNANEEFKYISFLTFFERFLFVIFASLGLYLGFGIIFIVIVSLISKVITLSINILIAKRLTAIRLFRSVKLNKRILRSSFTFSLIAFIAGLGTRVDVLMVSLLGTSEEVGIYGIAFALSLQGDFFRNVIAIALFPIAIKTFNLSPNKYNIKKILSISGLFFMGVLLLCTFFSFYVEELIIILFGKDYAESGIILSVLIFYYALTFATIPFTTILQAIGEERYLLINATITALINIPLNYVFYHKFGLIGIAYSTLIVNFFGSLFVILITIYILKKHALGLSKINLDSLSK